MNPFRPRRLRFVWEDCRIVAVRAANDPWFDLDFLRDRVVQEFFRDQDLVRDRVRVPELDPLERDQTEQRAAARHARAGRRIR